MRETSFSGSMLIGNSRSGQKGTVGLVIPEQDMPFTKDGIRPDIIINPHAIPTRMTIGQLVEGITGKACAMYGGSGDCTAFNNKGSKIKIFGEMLTDVGYHSSGNEILYNGMTGDQISAEIFMGPTYYMRLKHMVKDKINYRSLGPRTALTRQPVSGRANDGGLRIGEMERDSVISHGATEFLRESMMERGDKYHIAICNNTGMMAIYNPAKNIFMSPMADGPIKYTGALDGKDMNIENVTKFGRNFSVVAVPYSFKLLLQELQTVNIQMRIITEDNIQQFENMSYSKNIEKLLHTDKFDPKSMVNEMKRQLINKTDVFDTPDSIKSLSPEFATGSPAYVPPEEEYERLQSIYKKTAAELEKSPEYDPTSGERIYSPHTPDFPPNDEERRAQWQMVDSPSTNLDILKEQAQTYTVGETVHYSGDNKPERIWKITEIGPTLITIKAQTFLDELYDMDNTMYVTALDIYRPGDFVKTSPLGETTPIVPVAQATMNGGAQGYGQVQGQGYDQGYKQGNPLAGTPINFAPVFKIMNGGSDFSTGNPGEVQMEGGTSIGDAAPLLSSTLGAPMMFKQDGGAGEKKQEEKKPEEQSGGGGFFDFGKVVIKKLGF
jgi:hypothetical protein